MLSLNPPEFAECQRRSLSVRVEDRADDGLREMRRDPPYDWQVLDSLVIGATSYRCATHMLLQACGGP